MSEIFLERKIIEGENIEREKHERVRCPRCGKRFACKINAPFRCDCMDIRLMPEEMAYILLLADGECLCPSCLEQLRTEYRMALDP